MSSKSSSARNSYENEFAEFLINRLTSAGGTLRLQHITGHLSGVRPEVKNAVVNSKADLLHFLKRHKNIFIIDNGNVSLASSTLSTSGYDSDCSSTKSQSNLPQNIENGKGVIVKICTTFGFIKSKEPIKTDIFFNSRCFGKRNVDLTSFLHVGAIVFFDARRESSDEFSSKYRAYKIWRTDNADAESNTVVHKPRKTRETGLYDAINLESEGIIQNVFPNLGFISVKGDDNNTVFFHKNRVVNYDNVVDLTKVFSKGDRVEFAAHRSSKPDAKARWEATKVWKVSGKILQSMPQSDSIQAPAPKQPPAANFKAKTHEMIKNQRGKIYPRSGGAIIKFGNNELADADSALYYICGTQVIDVGWEFIEGDDVSFDAVRIKSAPGWKAVLVWTDSKPDVVLPTCLGDFSEFTEEEDNEDISDNIYNSRSSLCVSESSNSSLKSERITSKAKDLKRQEIQKSLINKEIRNVNKKLSKSSNASSRESLNSLSSLKHTPKKLVEFSSSKSINPLSKITSNWGDSPYPVDEAYESIETLETFKSDLSLDNKLEFENDNKELTEDEIENSSEYASAEEEKSDKSSKIENDERENDKTLDNSKPSIQRYHNIKGRINKVCSRFAQIKSSKLENTVSFYLNDFYYDGMSTDELELDDLKQILKVGDNIHFNYFVIIDDSGQSWQKITMVWIGLKPKHSNEITPEEFIKQNNLSVTVNNKINNEERTNKMVERKFLTSFVDEEDNKPDKKPDNKPDNLSRTESCSEEELSLTSQSHVYQKTEIPNQLENLSNVVCEILKRDIFSEDTMVNIKSVSKEIVTVILQNCMKKPSACSISVEENLLTRASDICSKCKENSSSYNSTTVKNASTQTIITGDIISQNIIPNC